MVNKIIFAAMLVSGAFSTLACASDSSNEILKAYHSADGHILVELNSTRYPSGNVFFLGDAKKLNQLEITWDDANGDERVLTYVSVEDGESSEISLSPNAASVENGLKLGHPHIDKMTLMAAADLKSISKASLHNLPDVWKSKYLFQSSVSGEYVLVKEPVFNFHGNYRVWIGDLNHMTELAVKTPENWKEGVAGNVAFVSGGGLFIPKMGEILSTLHPSQAEMPTLVRTSSSTFETLKVPRLSSIQLARLGFIKENDHVLSAQR